MKPDLDNANVGKPVLLELLEVIESVTSFFICIFRRKREMVKVNGAAVEAAGQTLSEYLTGTNHDPKRIAVEINEQIVPKNQYDTTIIEDGDIIEIVSFVGGG